jgi:hypothetical protein
VPEVIRGVVHDQHSLPLGGARVYFLSGPVPLPDVAAMTGPDGVFTLTAPVPGTYAIQCTLVDGRSAHRSVSVEAGSETTVAFDMSLES